MKKGPTSSHFRKEVSALESPRALQQWAKEKSRGLLPSRSDHRDEIRVVWEAVASFGRHFDPPLIQALCQQPAVVARLARNARLGEEGDRELIECCLTGLAAGLRVETGVKDPWPVEGLSELMERERFSLASPQGERLWALWQQKSKDYTVSEALIRLFLRDPAMSADRLAEMALVGNPYGETLHSITEHPNSDVRVWSRQLRGEWSYRTMMPLAGHPRARVHPEIRQTMLLYGRYASAKLLVTLSPDASPEEYAENFRAILRLEPKAARESLQKARPEQLRALAQEDLLPLLTSTSAEDRLAAIAAAGHARPGAEAVMARLQQAVPRTR